jgi:hypothetical protein
MLLNSPKDFENCGCIYELLSFECKSLSPKWSTGFPDLQKCFLKAAKTPASRFEKKSNAILIKFHSLFPNLK